MIAGGIDCTMTEEILAKWNAAHERLESARQAIDDFQGLVRQLQEQQTKQFESLKMPAIPNMDEQALRTFLQQPYLVMPKRENTWYVIVPRFIDMQVGWLEYQSPSFNVFVINKYVRWLTPLPAEIEKRLGMQPTVDLKVIDGLLKPTAGMEEETWQRYRKYLTRKDQFGLRIKQGYERHLISELIRDGYLPFTPQPVDPEDLNPVPEGFVMEPHQKEAYDAFLKWGAIGLYWPGGQGKTFFAAALCKMVKGPKLVVVPNVSEKEQWLIYLQKFGAVDVDLLTYQAFHKARKEYMLAVFDECHRLPAPVWSRYATVNSKYRLGLSATPYREDGREDLIIALTGFPVGLSWEHFMRVKAIRKPKVTVKVVNNDRDKMTVLEDMLKVPMKTLVFVELIASGERIKKQFNLPFVYGATKDRLEIISKNLVTVVSRVGDEGISIKDLERTVEVEFLGSSRRQEAQRAYRLLHSVKPEISHTVIMTVAELDQFSGRFLALEEKGFQVEYVT
jgi:DNA excision repair protein ERCC-3